MGNHLQWCDINKWTKREGKDMHDKKFLNQRFNQWARQLRDKGTKNRVLRNRRASCRELWNKNAKNRGLRNKRTKSRGCNTWLCKWTIKKPYYSGVLYCWKFFTFGISKLTCRPEEIGQEEKKLWATLWDEYQNLFRLSNYSLNCLSLGNTRTKTFRN